VSAYIEDGGPAYPTLDFITPERVATNRPGMTLRDYFAAKAPPPPPWWIKGYGPGCSDLAAYGRLIADWNWAYADAVRMHSARFQPPPMSGQVTPSPADPDVGGELLRIEG